MINFQRPAFLDLNNFHNKHLYIKLLSQFRVVHVGFILMGLFHIHRQLSFGHKLTFIHYIQVYFAFVFLDRAHYSKDFVKSRFIISRFCSIHFIVILAELKKVVRYTEDFVILRIIKPRQYKIAMLESKGSLKQDKQTAHISEKSNFLCLSFPNASLALQYGGFAAGE